MRCRRCPTLWSAAVVGVMAPLACSPGLRPPEPTIPQRPAPVVAPSRITVPITISLAEVQRFLEATVPDAEHVPPYNLSVNGGADQCRDPKGMGFGFDVRREALRVRAGAASLATTIDLSYWVRGRARPEIGLFGCGPLVSGSCGIDGEARRTATVSFTTALAVTPAWALEARTSASPAAAGSRCRVTIANIDVTDRVMDAFNRAFGAAAARLDERVASVADLRARVTTAWQAMAQPLAVADSGWLVVQPVALARPEITSAGDSLRVMLSLDARTELILGPRPAVTPVPLPDGTDLSSGPAFTVRLPIRASYAFASEQLASAFRLRDGGLRYPAAGRRHLRPREVLVYGYGEQAVVRVRFDGSARGVLYLTGTPRFDAVTRQLSFPDLDYTLETRNLLLRVASWFEGDAFRDDMRQRLVIHLNEQVQRAEAVLRDAINRDAGMLRLTGSLTSLELLGIYVNPERGTFEALTTATGVLSAAVVTTAP